jgi:glycosyltransferase involved in cell wall biosynthesis
MPKISTSTSSDERVYERSGACIAIDLTSLLPQPSGVDRYMLNLASSLTELERPDTYIFFVNREDRERIHDTLNGRARRNVRVMAVCRRPRPVRLLFQQAILPCAINALQIDVLHSPAFLMPLISGGAGHVVTIHDMTPLLLPEHHPQHRRGRLYEAMLHRSIRQADIVSVPSRSVRNDILELVPRVDPDRVRVIPYGVDDAFKPYPDWQLQPVLQRLGIHWPFILYVGTLDPRKNIPLLVETYGRLVEKGAVSEHLVLAGQHGWSTSQLAASMAACGAADKIHLLGYVAEDDLPCLYAAARVFVYPTLSEGFGFPPLEAMACGTPVVASDSSSLRENLFGAAELVPAGDGDALLAAIERMLKDDHFRTRHIAAGLERSKQFRWSAFAEQTSDCYREICRNRSSGHG